MLSNKDVLTRVEERYDDIYELAEVLGIDDFDDNVDIEVFIRYHRSRILNKQKELEIW
jgi:hypothetical protein